MNLLSSQKSVGHIRGRCCSTSFWWIGFYRCMLLFTCVYLSFTSSSINAKEAFEPADPEASALTQDTLDYLWLVSNRKTKRILYGQYAAAEACCSVDEEGEHGFDRNIISVEKMTGRVPAIIGIDYNNYDAEHKATIQSFHTINTLAVSYANHGSLITVGYHAANPWTGGYWASGGCPGAFTDLTDPTKRVHAAWQKQLSDVATGLAELQNAHVTVLWRPFMEMNANAHWWWQDCHPTQAQFRVVWKQMFDYFAKKRGLHNLLWIYAPVTQVGDNRPALELYPGGDLVDIAGYDTYHDYADWPDYASWQALGKTLAYTERGPHSTDGKSKLFTKFLDEIENKGWKISFFQAWSGSFHPQNNPGGVPLIEDDRVADQADVAVVLACIKDAQSLVDKKKCILR